MTKDKTERDIAYHLRLYDVYRFLGKNKEAEAERNTVFVLRRKLANLTALSEEGKK